ncbi:MAG: FAD-dependent oxidoreductase [Gammaproteobacteria bacterium]|nr:FAD-dependent oxidoreductase [Gammaproteobacteria bacterium]
MNTPISYGEALSSYQIIDERPLPKQNIPAEKLLSNFHPDYQIDSRVPLEIGANRGDPCHPELARLLQGDALIDEADLAGAEVVTTDVLVIGGGGAGASAALIAAETGAKVILATKLRLGDSNTVMAEGGIQASIEPEDTPQRHFDDTLKAGYNSGSPELIEQLALDGPDVIRWLIQKGMHFDYDEFGDLNTRRAGGTTADRVVYFRDYTGLEMMRVLREAVHNSSVEVWDYSPAVELLTNDSGGCSGAVISYLKSERYIQVKARSVIIATGGIGRVHLNGFPTSNHFGATGDGLSLAYRLGAKLRDLDSFQYHPTGLAYPKHLSGTLITEGVRSAGTWLLNNRGERFVDELGQRDQVAAAILRECSEGRGIITPSGDPGVWLDTAGLEHRYPGILEKRFPKLIHLGERSGINPKKQPMLVYPTLHYQNGGVVIDKDGQTTIPGLYCVGESSGGIHGKNRLMGNALLEIISFGRRAGAHAAENRKRSRDHKKVSLEHISRWRREMTLANLSFEQKSPLLFPDVVPHDDDARYDGGGS